MGPGLRPWYPTQAVLLSQIDVERPEETLPNIIEKGVKCCSSNLLARCAFEIVRQMSVSCLSLSKISVGWAGKAGQTFRAKTRMIFLMSKLEMVKEFLISPCLYFHVRALGMIPMSTQ